MATKNDTSASIKTGKTRRAKPRKAGATGEFVVFTDRPEPAAGTAQRIIGAAIAELPARMDSTDHYEMAFLASQAVEIEKAGGNPVELYESAFDAFPDHLNICLTLYRYCLESDREDLAARAVYQRAAELAPGLGATRLREGESLMRADRLDQALPCLERLVSDLGDAYHEFKDPPDLLDVARRKATLLLARVYSELNLTHQRAIDLYRASLEIDPSQDPLILLLGLAYARENVMTEEALEAMRAAAKVTPDGAVLTAGLARAEFHLGDRAQAIARIREARETDPDDPLLIDTEVYLIATARRKQPPSIPQAEAPSTASSAPAEAEVEVEKQTRSSEEAETLEPAPPAAPAAVPAPAPPAATIIPPPPAAAVPPTGAVAPNAPSAQADFNVEVEIAEVATLFEKGEREESLALLRRLAKARPDARPVIIACLGEISAVAPDYVPARLLLADLLIDDGRPDEALELARDLYTAPATSVGDLIHCLGRIQAVSTDPGPIILEKSALYKSMGMFLEAAEELRPLAQNAQAGPGIQQEYEEALEIATRTDRNPKLRFELARHYLKTGQFVEATELLQALCAADEKNAEYARWLGIAHMRMGRFDLARKQLEKAPVDEALKPVLYDLASELARQFQFDQAVETIERILQVDPGYGDINHLHGLWKARAAQSQSRALVHAQSGQLPYEKGAQERYELLELLGQGANGEVYKAYDSELDEIVALKILPEEVDARSESFRRFRLEAKTGIRLAHPNIVRVFDLGRQETRSYLAMEFVDGVTLRSKLAANPKPPAEEICRVVHQVALALRHAHARGVIHRDVKPSNVLIDMKGVAKLVDFGVAALGADRDTYDGGDRAFAGTPPYMAPEQIIGQRVDARSDLYALGNVLYEMLEGAPPFPDGDVSYRQVHEQPKPPVTPFVDLARMAVKCIEKAPEQRYQSAGEFIAELKNVARRYGVELEETS